MSRKAAMIKDPGVMNSLGSASEGAIHPFWALHLAALLRPVRHSGFLYENEMFFTSTATIRHADLPRKRVSRSVAPTPCIFHLIDRSRTPEASSESGAVGRGAAHLGSRL